MIKNRKVNVIFTKKEIDSDFLIDLFTKQIKQEISQSQHKKDEK